jgi:hypothetical protein
VTTDLSALQQRPRQKARAICHDAEMSFKLLIKCEKNDAALPQKG